MENVWKGYKLKAKKLSVRFLKDGLATGLSRKTCKRSVFNDLSIIPTAKVPIAFVFEVTAGPKARSAFMPCMCQILMGVF